MTAVPRYAELALEGVFLHLVNRDDSSLPQELDDWIEDAVS